jgi:hypothetical protein
MLAGRHRENSRSTPALSFGVARFEHEELRMGSPPHLSPVLIGFLAASSLLLQSHISRAQESALQGPSQAPISHNEGTAASGPGGLDPSVARQFGLEQLFGNLPSGQVATAPPSPSLPQPAGPTHYINDTLRVINDGAPRGCGYSDWNCMTNLCKADLGSAAWRGWAGCYRSGGVWICYFECGRVADVF